MAEEFQSGKEAVESHRERSQDHHENFYEAKGTYKRMHRNNSYSTFGRSSIHFK